MNKKLMIMLLVAGLLVGGAGMALAAGNGNGYGLEENRNVDGSLQAQGYTPEESLKIRLERIEALEDEGLISNEEAQEYASKLKERAERCDGTGTLRESEERLGIGFGRLQEKGQGQRQNSGQMGYGLRDGSCIQN